MACLLCPHDTSNERETNQQETNDQNAKMSCLQWKHKQFIQEIAQTTLEVHVPKCELLYGFDLNMRAKQKHTRAKQTDKQTS